MRTPYMNGGSVSTAKLSLTVDGKEHNLELPIVVGSEGEVGIDTKRLRAETGVVALDPGFGNTASCTSAITYIDGAKGILRYRGIPIDQLGEKSTFVEVSYLLINGRLPTKAELVEYSHNLTMHSMIHEDMRPFFDGYPLTAHPMGILSAMVCSLSSFYPEALDASNTRALRHHRHALVVEAENHRGVLLQEVDRAAVHVSAQRAQLLREPPSHDVR